MSADKRFSRGLSFLVSYTWSKTIDYAGQFGSPTDLRNLERDRGPADFSAPRRLTTSFVYELPFKADGPLNRVVGGWQVNGILSMYDGLPMSVTSPNTTNCCSSYRTGWPTGACRGANNGSTAGSTRTRSRGRGRRCSATGGRGILFGPGTKNMDFSLFKNFMFGEDGVRRLQFRAEFFNFTNTPQFNNPNTNIGSADVARVNSAGSPITLQRIPRHIQFALKYYF